MSGLGPSNELTGTSQRHAGIGSHEAECIGGVQVLGEIRTLPTDQDLWMGHPERETRARPMCALFSHLCLQWPSSAFPGCVLWKPSEHAHSIYKSSQRWSRAFHPQESSLPRLAFGPEQEPEPLLSSLESFLCSASQPQ